MDDTLQPPYPPNQLLRVVKQALRTCRDEPVAALAESPLAQTSLVKECFLKGEARTLDQQGLCLYGVLRWAVETLRPAEGVHGWEARSWRLYNSLYFPYFGGRRIAEVANAMKMNVKAFYEGPWALALVRVVKLLRQELLTSQWRKVRHRYALDVRWEALSADERLLCGLAALLRGQLPRELIYFQGTEGAMPDLDAALGTLLASGLLRGAKGRNSLTLQPDFCALVAQRLTPESRRLAHERAAHYYESQKSYLEAAYHFYQTGERVGRERATHLLLDQWQELRQHHTLRELGEFLKLFERPDPPDPSWYRLKVLMGDVALETEGVERAIAEYTEAFGTREHLIRALAHYRLGEAQKRSEKLGDEGLENCKEALRLLEQLSPPPALLGEVLIDYAWFFIQEWKDPRRASSILHRARRVMYDEPTVRAKWYNAFAGLHARLEHKDETLNYRLKALVAAEASGDRLLQSKILKNLSVDYAELAQDFDLALEYLFRALQLARKEEAKPLEGLCLKDQGGWLVLRWGDPDPELVLSEAAQRDYRTAIGYYQQAYRIFEDTHHHNWRAGVCLDLAEAHAALIDGPTACRYYVWGCAIARAFGHRIYLDFAKKLLHRWPIIRKADIITKMEPNGDQEKPVLNDRQWKILEYVARHGSITKAQHHAQYPSISGATATRDLKELVKKGLLAKVGKGPSTAYTFPPFGEGSA